LGRNSRDLKTCDRTAIERDGRRARRETNRTLLTRPVVAVVDRAARIAAAGDVWQAKHTGAGRADLRIAASGAAAAAIGAVVLHIDARGVAAGLTDRAGVTTDATVGIILVERLALPIAVAIAATRLASTFALLAAFAFGAVAAVLVLITFLADLFAAGSRLLTSSEVDQRARGGAEEGPYGASA